MHKLTSRTIILAGAVVAMFGAVAVFAYGRSVTNAGGDRTSVIAIVATKDIPAGTKAGSINGSVSETPVPASARPTTAIDSLDELAGRMTVRAITKGEVITTAQFGRLQKAAPGAGLEIPPGHNAVTLAVPPPQGIGHHAQVGDLVNIYVTLRGQPGGSITKLLLSNVQVLANRSAVAGQSKSVASGGEVMLTLALEPSQAEKVVFAKENGSLWFGLVHPGDEPASTGDGRTASNVLK